MAEWRLRLPGALLRKAQQRAGSDFTEVCRRLLELYADEQIDPLLLDPIASAWARRSGLKAAQGMSAQARTERARKGGLARAAKAADEER